jgi:transketolase
MEEIRNVESEEEPAIEEDLPEEPVEEEEELQEEETDTRPVYKEDMKEIAGRRRLEVQDLSKKLSKYVDNAEAEIKTRQIEIKTLERVAEELPERPELSPDLPFGEMTMEEREEVIEKSTVEEDEEIEGEVDTLEAAGVTPIAECPFEEDEGPDGPGAEDIEPEGA